MVTPVLLPVYSPRELLRKAVVGKTEEASEQPPGDWQRCDDANSPSDNDDPTCQKRRGLFLKKITGGKGNCCVYREQWREGGQRRRKVGAAGKSLKYQLCER